MGYKNYGCKVAAAKRMQSCLDQLRAEGIDIGEELEFCESEQESAPLQITGDMAGICDLPYDTAYKIPIRIIARQSITVDACRIEAPWEGPVHLADDRKWGGRYHLGPFNCRTDEFLNDKFIRPLKLRRGAIIEGTIFALGFPIPPEVESGIVKLRIIVVDCFGREAWADVNAMVRRNLEIVFPFPHPMPAVPVKRDRPRNWSGLYDPDPEGINEGSESMQQSDVEGVPGLVDPTKWRKQ